MVLKELFRLLGNLIFLPITGVLYLINLSWGRVFIMSIVCTVTLIVIDFLIFGKSPPFYINIIITFYLAGFYAWGHSFLELKRLRKLLKRQCD